ncbi:MAG: zinc ribbon domain-containing protein [Bdellovibrionota bacterium]
MIGLIFWVGFAIGVGFLARSYNRSGLTWGILAVLISPILSVIFLLVAGRAEEIKKTCPKCTEKSPKDAKSCRFCGYSFELGVISLNS